MFIASETRTANAPVTNQPARLTFGGRKTVTRRDTAANAPNMEIQLVTALTSFQPHPRRFAVCELDAGSLKGTAA